MGTWLIPLLTLTAGALLSSVVTYAGTRSKLALDYDADLRQKRIDVYTDLWGRLEPLSKYVPPTTFRVAEVKQLAESLQAWYFGTGGLFLSMAARGEYLALQDTLQRISDGWGWEESGEERLIPAVREYVRVQGSRLRTSLTRDVATRTRPKVPGRPESDLQRLAGIYERDDQYCIQLVFAPWILGGPRRLTLRPLRSQGPIRALCWDRTHLTVRAELSAPGGSRRQRVFLVEDGWLIEGPVPDEQTPDVVVLWRKVADGTARGPR